MVYILVVYSKSFLGNDFIPISSWVTFGLRFSELDSILIGREGTSW